MPTARSHIPITKSDTTVIEVDALWVSGTGDVVCLDKDGTTATYTAVPAGAVIPISASKVMSTGTTATGIVGLLY